MYSEVDSLSISGLCCSIMGSLLGDPSMCIGYKDSEKSCAKGTESLGSVQLLPNVPCKPPCGS